MDSKELRNLQKSHLGVYFNEILDESSQDYIIPKHVADGVMKGTTSLVKSAVKGGAKLAHGVTKYGVKKFVQHGEQQPEGSKRRKAAEVIKKAREATLSPQERKKREQESEKKERELERFRQRRERERERARARYQRTRHRTGTYTGSGVGRRENVREDSCSQNKSYQQFKEDVEQRRQLALQKSKELQAAQQRRIAAHQEAQKEKIEQQRAEKQERDAEAKRINQLKQELRQELQTEQTPSMKPNLYNQLIAKSQIRRKSERERHAQREIEHEAGIQQAAKKERMKELMNR